MKQLESSKNNEMTTHGIHSVSTMGDEQWNYHKGAENQAGP